ncbi:prepilin peptidase [Salipiger mangrovisoli]|uniref:Prepilin peptidase n=1 Tax=Salipiger mangrovisoli TaxID=2865933 RepID=A0ABR9X8I0_9RHOB|nr:prepilin peptidase [Salipiger mangrovisoli]MBE9639876.1 prepilin peptidase [Salipiger mangrovisoli]
MLVISATAALWFLPPVLVVCLWVCFTDMKYMRILNKSVIALAAIFVVLGPFVLPLGEYGWRLVQMLAVLVAGIALNAGGAVGAGDAKFAAAAAPFIHLGDLRFVMALFAATLLGAFASHRIMRATPLRKLAPDWKSWETGSRFPMGLALAGTLVLYLLLGALYGTAPV